MIVRASYGGSVTEKLVLPGNYVMAGERLYTLADLSRVWLYVDVYEKDVASIREGQEVVVTTSAWPGETFTGRVSFINPIVDDATRTVKVRAEFANPDGKLKPNMLADVTIRIPLEETLVVPASSLIDTGSRKVVYVAEGEDRFVKRDVVVGQEAEGYIQVLSGLQPGDTVVTAAAFLIDSQTQLGSFGGHGGGASSGNNRTPAPHSGPVPPAPATPVPAAPSPGQSGGNQHSGHGGH